MSEVKLDGDSLCRGNFIIMLMFLRNTPKQRAPCGSGTHAGKPNNQLINYSGVQMAIRRNDNAKLTPLQMLVVMLNMLAHVLSSSTSGSCTTKCTIISVIFREGSRSVT